MGNRGDGVTVSIVIPTWNGRELLRECLASLAEQDRAADEVIVVDNGSADGTAEMAGADFPWAKVLRLERNEGFARAVNRGIRIARGSLVGLVNNDAVCGRGWVAAMAAAAEANPWAGFFASKVVFYDDPGVVDSAGDEYTGWGMVFNRGHGERDAGQYDAPAEVFGACAAAAVYRAEMLRETGLMDENFFAYYEDVDLSFRARLLGYRCLYVPGAVVRHRYGGATGGTPKLGREEVYVHLTALALKNMPAALFVRYFVPGFFFHALVLILFAAARLRGGGRLPRAPFLRLMRNMLRQRGAVQRGMRVSPRELEEAFARRGFARWFFGEARQVRRRRARRGGASGGRGDGA
ncbi:MAG: glycosyltransferase family 2 protein [bacterium]